MRTPLALAIVLVLVSCTGPGETASTPGSSVPPVETTAPATTDASSATTTDATSQPAVTSTEIADTFLPDPMEMTDQVIDFNGGASIGDSFYPELGNAGYDVGHVELAIDFRTVEDGHFTGEAILHVTPSEPIETFVIDTGTVLLTEVWEQTDLYPDEWLPARFGRESETEFRIGLGGVTDQPFKVRIAYRGFPEPMRHPSISFELGIRSGPDSWYAVSEPAGATTWFPANDHPLDKATYTISLTVDEGLQGIAGGILVATEEAIGGGTTYTWEHGHPISSYLVTLAVGVFSRVDREPVGGVILRDYIDPDARSAAGNLDRTAEILEWMVSVFGPYPFDAYGTLVVDEPFGGALENQTLPIHGPDALGTTVIVHEMAHQWYGDSVSVADWSDIWLNEGFATYAEWLWVEHNRGAALYTTVAEQGFQRYKEFTAPGQPSRAELFNGGVYVGGATVLHHLRVELGDGPFFALLKAYASEFAYGNASTEDFIDMAERFAARQLDDFFETWLSGEGEAYTPLGG